MRSCQLSVYVYMMCVWHILDLRLVNAYSIDCSAIECRNSFINCLPFEDCFISCFGAQECAGSLIKCPANGNCSVSCIGDKSCYETIIDATLSAGSLTVSCGDHTSQFTDHCNKIKIFGSTLRQNTGDFIVHCIGHCIDSHINCAFNGDCHVFCDGDSSCLYSKVTGPIFGDISIQCNAQRSCNTALFNAAMSSKLSIKGCHALHSCLDLILYCPPHTNGDKHCFIEGNNNLGVDKSSVPPSVAPTAFPSLPSLSPSMTTTNPTDAPSTEPTTTPTDKPSVSPTAFPGYGVIVYAVNGWKDIAINYTGTFSDSHGGKMYCGDMYHFSCDLAINDWSCDNAHHYCNDRDLYKPSTTLTSTNIAESGATRIVSTKTNVQNTDKLKSTVQNADKVKSTVHDHDSPVIEYGHASIKKRNANLFILICIASVGCTCIGVGCAQIRKNMIEQQKAHEQEQAREQMQLGAPVRRQRSLSSKRNRSASLRHQRSLSSKHSASMRHQQSASMRDKPPNRFPGYNSDCDVILI